MPQAEDVQGMVEASGGLEQPKTSAGRLISQTYNNLTNLLALMDRAKGITPEDKQALAGVIQQFQSFVENNLSAQPGQNPEQPQQASAPVDMETAGKPAVPQMF